MRRRLIEIRDLLTNETYIFLEQAHRHDQDLLDKHARAITEWKHICDLQQAEGCQHMPCGCSAEGGALLVQLDWSQ